MHGDLVSYFSIHTGQAPGVIFRRVHGPGVIFGYSPTPGVIFGQKDTLCDNFYPLEVVTKRT